MKFWKNTFWQNKFLYYFGTYKTPQFVFCSHVSLSLALLTLKFDSFLSQWSFIRFILWSLYNFFHFLITNFFSSQKTSFNLFLFWSHSFLGKLLFNIFLWELFFCCFFVFIFAAAVFFFKNTIFCFCCFDFSPVWNKKPFNQVISWFWNILLSFFFSNKISFFCSSFLIFKLLFHALLFFSFHWFSLCCFHSLLFCDDAEVFWKLTHLQDSFTYTKHRIVIVYREVYYEKV